jgi:hypothetical protein
VAFVTRQERRKKAMKTFRFVLLAVALFILGSLTTPTLFASGLLQERNGVLCTAVPYANCVEIWNGFDIIVYSDEASTQKYLMDGATGTIDSEGDVILAGVVTTEESDNTTTGAQTLVPTKTYYHFAPTAVTTVTISTTGVVEGDWLVIHNLVSTSTVIVDTTATVGGGNITLGTDDVAGFIYGDGVWVEIFSPDNS